jgi:beta-glucosidase
MTAAERVLVRLVSGESPSVERSFPCGVPAGALSVGTEADWIVRAPGVERTHLALTYDGQRLYAASIHGAAAYANSVALTATFSPLPLPCELHFGRACLRATLEQSAHAEGAGNTAQHSRLPSYFVRVVATARTSEPPPPEEERHARQRASSTPRARASSLPAAGGRRIPWAMVGVFAALPLLALSSYSLVRHFLDKGTAAPLAASASAAPPASSAPPTPESPLPAAPALDTATPSLLPVPVIAEEPPARSDLVRSSPVNSESLARGRAFAQNVSDRPIPRIGDKPWLIAEDWRLHHERLLAEPGRAAARVVFIGDSITEGWRSAPSYRDRFARYSPLNLGIAGDTTQNVLWRLEHGELDGVSPAVAVVMLGVNNLAGGFTAAQTVAGVRAVVAVVRAHLPATHIVLLGVLPAREAASDPLRQKIIDTNLELAKLADTTLVFRDVGRVLLEPDGSISKDILRDFVHPTAAGYERVTAEVAPLIEELARGE